MSQLINECCDHVRLEGTHELKLSGDLNIQVYADRQKIDQVIVNLINNAIKYAPNSKIVNLHIDFDGKCVKVSVQDFGIGIPKHKLGEVFNRFYQIDSSNFQFSGLGLGLYISSQIIKQHQGKIGVESEPEQGRTFWFSIPRE